MPVDTTPPWPALPPTIDFDTNPSINPDIGEFLRDFLPDWCTYARMGEPGWRFDGVVARATAELLYNFDFPDYHCYDIGVYRDALEKAIRQWFNNRLPPVLFRGDRAPKSGVNLTGGLYYVPGIERRRDPDLQWQPTPIPLPAFLPAPEAPPSSPPVSSYELRPALWSAVKKEISLTTLQKRHSLSSRFVGSSSTPLDVLSSSSTSSSSSSSTSSISASAISPSSSALSPPSSALSASSTAASVASRHDHRRARRSTKCPPGWKGWAQVPADYIPPRDQLVDSVPYKSSRTRSGRL